MSTNCLSNPLEDWTTAGQNLVNPKLKKRKKGMGEGNPVLSSIPVKGFQANSRNGEGL